MDSTAFLVGLLCAMLITAGIYGIFGASARRRHEAASL
jgi:hypothetical protein